MKRLLAATWLCAAAFVARADAIQDLGWMSGSWIEHKGDAGTEEHWLDARGGVMLGMSRAVRGEKMVSFEHLRIESRDGKLVYLSSPSGRPWSEFAAVEQAPTKIVFEDPAREFPRRILYWRDGEALVARIEGTINGQPRAREWRYERAHSPL